MSEVSPPSALWPWWVIFPPFRWWRWGPPAGFLRESGIFSARWLWEGSALPEKEGRKSVNNSCQSQEGRRMWFLSKHLIQFQFAMHRQFRHRAPFLWSSVSFCKRSWGWAGWQGGEGQDDLQSLYSALQTLLEDRNLHSPTTGTLECL